jgi:hypothetical protein
MSVLSSRHIIMIAKTIAAIKKDNTKKPSIIYNISND